MIQLTLVYEGFGSLSKLQTVYGLHHLRSCSKSVCRMSEQEQDYAISNLYYILSLRPEATKPGLSTLDWTMD